MKNKNALQEYKRLGRYIFQKYKLRIAAVSLFLILSSLTSVVSSVFLKSLIDDYITPMLSQATPDFAPLINALFIMAGIFLFGVVATYLYSYLLIEITQGTLDSLRKDLFEKMETLPLRYFDTTAHGDIMSVYTNDTDTIRQVISQSIPQTFSSIVTIIGVVFSMLYTSWLLTLIIIVFIFIMQKAIKFLGSQSSKHFREQQGNLGKINGYIEEMMEGQRVVKVFNHEKQACQDFDKLNEELFESAFNANKYSSTLMPIVMNLGNLSYVFSAMLGGVFAVNGIGALTIGGLVSFLQLNRSFSMPISQISQQFNAIIMASAGINRIFALLDQTPEQDEGIVSLVNVEKKDNRLFETVKRTEHWAWRHKRMDGSVELVELAGDISFNNVDFSYNKEKQILFDIDMYAKPGQKIALVGATGAGKTTITNLINRFYDIQAGTIIYDGIDIKTIRKNDLRKSLGIVLQDTNLFSGTIKDNIRYSNPQASDDEVIAAAKLANAHSFIKHLENGYDTIIDGHGENLSQGQRQLLSIARAALANPPVLILDEATSSIDTRTEKIVQKGMDKLMEGRTVFVIAHRLSTIVNSDVIMVMDQGKIIERGNHETLLKQAGIYHKLYTGSIELS